MTYLKLMVYAQLNQLMSLSAISDALANETLQKELALDSVHKSQLSRTHRAMEPEYLAHIFSQLMGKIKQNEHRHNQKPAFKLIDSTTISLNAARFPWATFRQTKGGVKIHLRLTFMKNSDCYPDELMVTNAVDHDRNQIEVLIDEPLMTYVFDRGYMDFALFDRLEQDGYFFVTRLKKNTVTTPYSEYEGLPDAGIASDCLAFVGKGQQKTNAPFRVIEVKDSKGNDLRLVTNRFDLTATEISDMYRSRWEIELFFKWLKQHLVITHFYSFDPNAALNQIYIALISYCLLLLTKQSVNGTLSLLRVSRLWLATLWQAEETFLQKIRGRPKNVGT